MEGFFKEIVERINKAESAPRFRADFGGVVFPGPVDFTGSTLPDRLSFDSAHFSDTARFKGVTFGKRTWFDSARFSLGADFREAKFRRVSFNHVRFIQDARFDRAEFHHIATFREAKFLSVANFGGAIETDEPAAYSFRRCEFDGAEFQGRSTFNYRRFFDTASFQGAKFTQAPEFHNCVLHPDMDFSNLRFPSVEPYWGAARRHYRTLKKLMGEIQSRDDEAMFYAREQKCLRKLKETPSWVKLLSVMYAVTSDYGQSALRPFVWLLATTSIFSIIYVYVQFAVLVGHNALGSPLGFAVEQIVRPFAILMSGYKSERQWVTAALEAYPFWVPFFATVQSIISLGLLALLFLALRWRFRRG